MAKVIFITGGARSGKSTLAEKRTLELGKPAHYIATAQAFDGEMSARIALHQARRGEEWLTHAEPLLLTQTLLETDDAPRLVDCLTLWLSNLMLSNADWQASAREMLATLPKLAAPVVFVANEVGMGIVPDNRLARDFRDAAGFLNQWVAAQSDEVILTVAGLPMKVK